MIKPSTSNKTKTILGINHVEQFLQRRNISVSLSYRVIMEYSRSTCATVSTQSQWEHCCWSCRFNRYEWVRWVWPSMPLADIIITEYIPSKPHWGCIHIDTSTSPGIRVRVIVNTILLVFQCQPFTLIHIHYEFDFHLYGCFCAGLVSRQPVRVSM